MKVKILGIQKIGFTNNNGEVISGTNLFVAFPEENVDGLRREKFCIRDCINLPKDTKLNDMLDISFDRKGKVEMIFKAN